jgi:AcrR family transcriptional regulator
MPRAGLTPQRVIDAAAALADRDGLDGLTLGSVADELGVRPPSLYNHVDGLDDIRRGVRLQALGELDARLQRASVGRSGADAVHAMAAAYRAYALEHPGRYATVVPTHVVADAEISAAGARVVGTALAALRGFGLLGDDAIHAARTLRAAIHGFVALEQAGGFGLEQDPGESFEWMVTRLAMAFTGPVDAVDP